MPLSKKTKYLILFLIHLFSFVMIGVIKRNGINFASQDAVSLIIYLLTSFASSFLTGKFREHNTNNSFYMMIKPYFNSLILTSGILGLFFLLPYGLSTSRLLIAGTLFLSFISEIIFIFTNYKVRYIPGQNRKSDFSYSVFLILSAVFCFTTFGYSYLFRIAFYNVNDFIALAILFLIWFFASYFIHHFRDPSKENNIWRAIWPHIKSNIVLISLTLFSLFIMTPTFTINVTPLKISIIYSFFSVITAWFIYVIYNPRVTDEVSPKLLKATLYEQLIENGIYREDKYYKIEKENSYNHYLFEQLSTIHLKKIPRLLEFISRSIDLFYFDFRKSVIIRSSDIYNVEVLPSNILEMFINLHEINDIRNVNKYFITINEKLVNGGVFVGKVEPNNLRYQRFIRKYPYYLARLFYFSDFIWKRVFPKMPFLKNIYFGINKGKDRAISLAESLGRLYYCGFEVIEIKEIDNYVYFIVKKVGMPLSDPNPSYGPLIKLKRIGKNGKEILVYKLRTMHPYSEYLQKFVYKYGDLKEGGKFKDDFRITSWGKVLRKLWIDELPMLINYFRGELKLVGVRPLSKHYYNLYDDELKRLRIKYKPGLVPPFYFDMPKTIEEIIESEKNYLKEYKDKPIRTDLKYFFGAFNNILFHSARSS